MPRSQSTFYHSLYFKLAASLFVGLVILLSLEVRLSIAAFRSVVSEINQSLEWDLAADVANSMQPALLKPVTAEEFLDIVYPFSVSNPKLEFYLLYADGRIFAHYTPQSRPHRKRVSIEPILEALKDRMPTLPHYGENPALADTSDTFGPVDGEGSVFSVAPIQFNGSDGYLYIIIEGEPFRRRIRMIGQFFVTRLLTSGWALAAVPMLVLGVLLFFLLTRRFRLITEAVARYESGDYREPLNIDSKDEIGVLSAALNSMSGKLIQAKKDIELRDEKRRQLIAFITHDLRTPLAATQGYLDLARDSEELKSSEKLARYVHLAADNSRLQSRLLEDLFEVSKLDAQEREPNFDEFRLEPLVEKAIAQFEAAAANAEVQLGCTTNGEPAYVVADDALLLRVLNNLIDNALRFTPAGGNIEISLAYSAKEVEVRVADTGKGISREKKDELLEIFAQNDVTENDTHAGAGLGLAIVERILNMHSSHLKIESQAGAGSCFGFTLSLASDE